MSSQTNSPNSEAKAETHHNLTGLIRNTLLLAAAALIAWSLLNPYYGSQSDQSLHVAHLATPSPPPAITIDKITVGQRVTALNPQRRDIDRNNDTEPDPRGWQTIELVHINDAMLQTRVTLLRPHTWFAMQKAEELGRITLSMPEVGADGNFLVIAIKPCPPIETGPGSVVTGTFAHETREPILAIYVEGMDKPITATANHPFWSETNQAFVEVGHMSPGDIVRTADGQLRRLTNIETRAGPAPGHATPVWVYNLEVAGEHVYHVGLAGVTVHNKGGRSNFRQRGFALNPRSHNFKNYRKTFFDANPELNGQVYVHHRVEQQVLRKYPGRFTEREIHALDNLRGIPKTLNPKIHLSAVRRAWNRFYDAYPNATKQQILDHAKKVDKLIDDLLD